MSAPAAVLSCGRRAAIAVCSVLTALCVVRQCKLKTPLPVAPHDYCRNIPRLAGKHVEQLTSVVASSRGNACRFVCSGPGSRSHLDRGSPLDGHSVYPKRQTLRPHALPLHRALLSRDDRARAWPRRHFLGHLRVDCARGRHRRRKPLDLVGDGAGVGEVLIGNADYCLPAFHPISLHVARPHCRSKIQLGRTRALRPEPPQYPNKPYLAACRAGPSRSHRGPYGLFEHLSQHVICLVHLHELLPNDPAEPLGPRRKATKPIMPNGNRSDVFSDRSVDEQFAGLQDTLTPPTALRARSACFRYSSQPTPL
jgi:hypothetical protein